MDGAASLRQSFTLPVDANFVGFRGSRDLERAVAAIRITPTHILNQGDRARAPQVLSAARYGAVTVLLHDDQVNAEPGGFWILARRPTRLTLAPDDAAAPATAPAQRRRRQPRHPADDRLARDLTLAADVPTEVTLPPAATA